MGKPILLDLFSGAGGATKGYQQAGFYVIGVDHKRQPRYCGDEFIQADALVFLCGALESGWIQQCAAIHASPPCQAHSKTKAINKNQPWRKEHPDLISRTRQLLQATGKPYVIENVEGAPLQLPITLCGTMFGLRVYRHRLFESNHVLLAGRCRAHAQSTGSHRGFSSGPGFISVAGHNFEVAAARAAMDIPWMMQKELAQAIPPAYTQFVGTQLMQAVMSTP